MVIPTAAPRAPAQPLSRAPVHVVATLLAIAAAALVLAATRLGAGATPDTGHYLATADNVLAGRGFVRVGPEIMASWPPLYPAVLAAFGAIGVDMLAGARVFNAAMLAICAAVCVWWVAARTESLAWGAAAGAAVAVSPPLLYSATLALSDAPFAALQVLALWQLDAWLHDHRRSTLIGCITFLALACLMRYNGVVLVATAALAALALARMPAPRRIVAAALIGAASLAPLALWIARNLRLTGTPAGPRVPSQYPLADAVADAGYTVMSWFVPYRVLTTSRWTGALLLSLLIVALAALAMRAARQPRGRTAVVCVTFLVLFLGFMILTFTRVSVDPLADRMLAPVYVPLVVATATAVSALALRAAPRLMLAVPALAAAVLLALVVGSRTAHVVLDSWRNGPGGAAHSNFNTYEWRSSPTLRWAGQHLREELVFASTPAALYIATGVHSRPMPRKHARRSPGVPHDRLPALREDVARRGDAYLVVSEGHVPSHTFTLEELGSAFVVERVQTFADGSVYRLTPRPGP